MLTAIKMDIASANRKINKSAEDSKVHLEEAMTLVDNMIKSVRKIASQLRPSVLDDLGLEPALDWQVQEFEKHNPHIQCSFYSSLGDQSLEKNVATTVYRIFQESLTNVARHAEATEVNAELIYLPGSLTMKIADNGKGIDLAAGKQKRTLGIVGMKERTHLLNGSITIDSTPGKGTTIVLTIPLS
jgi:signal transduction histidine kinase